VSRLERVSCGAGFWSGFPSKNFSRSKAPDLIQQPRLRLSALRLALPPLGLLVRYFLTIRGRITVTEIGTTVSVFALSQSDDRNFFAARNRRPICYKFCLARRENQAKARISRAVVNNAYSFTRPISISLNKSSYLEIGIKFG